MFICTYLHTRTEYLYMLILTVFCEDIKCYRYLFFKQPLAALVKMNAGQIFHASITVLLSLCQSQMKRILNHVELVASKAILEIPPKFHSCRVCFVGAFKIHGLFGQVFQFFTVFFVLVS